MPEFDPVLLEEISKSYQVIKGYRHQSPRRDPISGEGSRLNGGRFNPPNSFPVVYLCTTIRCAKAEFRRMVERQQESPEGFLPRQLWEISATSQCLLDLTDLANRARLSIAEDDLVSEEYRITHAIGLGVNRSNVIQAIRSPSATRQDDVLAIFRNKIDALDLSATLLDTWTTIGDI